MAQKVPFSRCYRSQIQKVHFLKVGHQSVPLCLLVGYGVASFVMSACYCVYPGTQTCNKGLCLGRPGCSYSTVNHLCYTILFFFLQQREHKALCPAPGMDVVFWQMRTACQLVKHLWQRAITISVGTVAKLEVNARRYECIFSTGERMQEGQVLNDT